MSKSLPTIIVLCGGRSAERFVSTVSAQCVVANLNPKKYQVRLIHVGIDDSWVEIHPKKLLAESSNSLLTNAQTLQRLRNDAKEINPWTLFSNLKKSDCVFPVLHGPMGEDGTLQGLLELTQTAYVGCGVFASAASMDKEATRKLADLANIPQAPWSVARSEGEVKKAAQRLGYPFFLKPARMGSSVGVIKVKNPGEITKSLRETLQYDDKAIVEKAINAREVEIAVLGDPWAKEGDKFAVKTSPIGEIIPNAEFYDYRAKYIDPNGAKTVVPAKLSAAATQKVKQYAVAIFKALDLYGLARVDFFVDKNTDEVYLNEPNTLPGFTPISMYPRLWQHAHLSTPKLIDTLIELAHKRAQRRPKIDALSP